MKITEICEDFDPYAVHNLQDPAAKEVTQVKKAKGMAEIIQKNCSEMLTAYRSTNQVLYRGIHGYSDAIVTGIRPDRRAVQMGNDEHLALHDGFLAAGLTATRMNSIFCSARPAIARSWGENVYIIFVKDGWAGTVFTKADKSDYTFYTMSRIAREFLSGTAPGNNTMKSMVREIKKLGPKDLRTSEDLIPILKENYADVLITGDSYIGLRAGSEICEKTLQLLGLKNIRY